jgi:hypothetical protein
VGYELAEVVETKLDPRYIGVEYEYALVERCVVVVAIGVLLLYGKYIQSLMINRSKHLQNVGSCTCASCHSTSSATDLAYGAASASNAVRSGRTATFSIATASGGQWNASVVAVFLCRVT